MSTSRLRPLRASQRCAFCGGSDLSKEHVWPKWMAAYFPQTAHDRRYEVLKSEGAKSGEVKSFERQERHGHTVTKKIGGICRRCNSGWMSVWEKDALYIVEAMLQGFHHTVLESGQRALERWICLKMMTIDLSVPADTVFLPAQRRALKDSQEIPAGLKIWLFPYGGLNWRSAMRQDSYLIGTSPDLLPHGSFSKNTKYLTWGVGALLISAFYTHVENFDDYVQHEYEGSVCKLLPRKEPLLHWPPGPDLPEKGANYVAERMTRLAQSPKVIAREWPI